MDGALAVLLGVILAVVAPRLWPKKAKTAGHDGDEYEKHDKPFTPLLSVCSQQPSISRRGAGQSDDPVENPGTHENHRWRYYDRIICRQVPHHRRELRYVDDGHYDGTVFTA